MKRHVYTSPAERRRDRHLGFLAFIVVNAITWLAYSALRQHAIQLAEEAAAAAAKLPPGMSMHFANPPVPLAIQILPWLVNGLILAIGLIFRPEFALGYMACFGMILLVCGGLATIVVMSCVATIISALILPRLPRWSSLYSYWWACTILGAGRSRRFSAGGMPRSSRGPAIRRPKPSSDNPIDSGPVLHYHTRYIIRRLIFKRIFGCAHTSTRADQTIGRRVCAEEARPC